MVSNLKKSVNNAFTELMNITTNNPDMLSPNSLMITKTALEHFMNYLTIREEPCEYCSSGKYIDEFGRIMTEYKYCPECGRDMTKS